MASGDRYSKWLPSVQLVTPNVLLPFKALEFSLHAEEGKHPLAQLTLRYFLSNSFRAAADSLPPSLWWPDNTPVEISYGSSALNAATFYGYVISPELLNDTDQGQQAYVQGQVLDVRYTLLGATKPLQTAKTEIWRHCTVAYMAQSIAQANGLAAVTDPHPRVFDSRQQASQSDFAFLQARASESGYRLAVDGTTLYLTDPRRALVSSTPNFVQHRVPGVQDTMQYFRPTVGEIDPLGAIRAQHASAAVSWNGVVTSAQAAAPRIDPVSGQNVSPQVTRYSSEYVAQGYADASAITQAAASRDLWWVHATAQVDGDVRLRPGCVINVGGDAVTSQYAGEWMVRCAHHRLKLDPLGPQYSEYYADLELGRDQTSTLTRVPSPVITQPVSTLINNKWQAGGAS